MSDERRVGQWLGLSICVLLGFVMGCTKGKTSPGWGPDQRSAHDLIGLTGELNDGAQRPGGNDLAAGDAEAGDLLNTVDRIVAAEQRRQSDTGTVLNDTCEVPTVITLSRGLATVRGNTVGATNAVDLSGPSSSCVKTTSSGALTYRTFGADLFYRIDLAAGKTYTFDIMCTAGTTKLVGCAVYLFKDCQRPAESCVGGRAATSTVFPEALLIHSETVGGARYVGVDAVGASSVGEFRLTVRAR